MAKVHGAWVAYQMNPCADLTRQRVRSRQLAEAVEWLARQEA